MQKKLALFIFVLSLGVGMLCYEPFLVKVLELVLGVGMEHHQGPAWETVLQLYDAKVSKGFHDCQHLQIPSSFGTTYVHDCGDKSMPVVFLFHGSRDTSAVWTFLMPALRNYRRVIPDYICDVGRSVPTRCPQNSTDHAVWVKALFEGVGIPPGTKATFIGYSYGGFVSATTALQAPELVERMVLIAPAAIFGSLTVSVWWHVLACVFLKRFGFNYYWIMKWLAVPGFDFKTHDMGLDWAVGEIYLEKDEAVMPVSFSDEELRTLTGICRVILLMPEFEVVVEPKPAMGRARVAGAEVVMVPNAGHLIVHERPKMLAEIIAKIMLSTK